MFPPLYLDYRSYHIACAVACITGVIMECALSAYFLGYQPLTLSGNCGCLRFMLESMFANLTTTGGIAAIDIPGPWQTSWEKRSLFSFAVGRVPTDKTTWFDARQRSEYCLLVWNQSPCRNDGDCLARSVGLWQHGQSSWTNGR